MWNTVFNINESTSLNKLIRVLVNTSILIINLNFMERVVTHATRMNDESTLCNTSHLLFLVLLIIVIMVRMDSWENWVRFTNYFKWL